MLNQIDIMGRFARDPELRRTKSGVAVASFTLSVERDYADKDSGARGVDFIRCIAWRGTAEFVSRHFSKGQLAAVSGRLQIRAWQDEQGEKHESTEVLANAIYFCGSKSSGTKADYAEISEADETLPF